MYVVAGYSYSCVIQRVVLREKYNNIIISVFILIDYYGGMKDDLCSFHENKSRKNLWQDIHSLFSPCHDL